MTSFLGVDRDDQTSLNQALTTPTLTNPIISGLLFESSKDGITAFAGGGQTNATAMTLEINRVTVSAATSAPFDSVKLPVSVAGLSIIVVNNTANPIQVFGAGTDTINGVATATGVTQAPNSVETYFCPLAGAWHADMGAGYSGSLFTEFAQDSIIAFAGGGQTNATQLIAQTNRIITVATAGDSVKLPASAPGLELMVINHGANAMQVFGLGTDTVDDQAAATGVSQMANSLVIYTCASAGRWYSEGLATGFGGPGLQTESFTNAITAFAGGGQGSATALTSMLNRVTVVNTAGDSVKLPASAAGLYITVVNSGANPCQVFGAGTDTINGVASGTGVSQMQNSIVVYSCPVAGSWFAEGIGSGFSGSLSTLSNAATVSAAGAAQGTATQLAAMINRVTTVAASTGVILPVNAVGLQITVQNSGANTLNIYPDTGAAINGLGTNIATQLPTGQIATLTCTAANVWSMLIITPRELNTAINTVGAGTLTAASLIGGVITRAGSVANYTDTTDTAANIIAALHGATIGQSWEVTIKNIVAFTQTLAAGAGVTLSGQTIIPPNSVGRFLLTFSAAGAVTMQGLAVVPISSGNIEVSTALTTVGNGTITAAGIAGLATSRGGAQGGTAFTDTTDTATNIVAAMPNASIGQAWEYTYTNNTNANATLAGGTGVTLAGPTFVAMNTWTRYLVTITSGTTVTMTVIAQGQVLSLPPAQDVANSTAGATTAAVGDITGANQCVVRLSAVGAANYTTRTAAQMIADLGGAPVGFSWSIIVQNTNAGTTTVVGGANVTVNGAGTVAQNTWRMFNAKVATATTITLQNQATGTFS